VNNVHYKHLHTNRRIGGTRVEVYITMFRVIVRGEKHAESRWTFKHRGNVPPQTTWKMGAVDDGSRVSDGVFRTLPWR
jgi:hypothetical protein